MGHNVLNNVPEMGFIGVGQLWISKSINPSMIIDTPPLSQLTTTGNTPTSLMKSSSMSTPTSFGLHTLYIKFMFFNFNPWWLFFNRKYETQSLYRPLHAYGLHNLLTLRSSPYWRVSDRCGPNTSIITSFDIINNSKTVFRLDFCWFTDHNNVFHLKVTALLVPLLSMN